MTWVREEWRPIPSLPGREASNWGRIRVTPWIGEMPNGGLRTYGGYPTCGVWERKHRRYIIQIDGHTYKVARLVCEAFSGPPPEDRPVCMHLNENSRDNRPGNLAWGTQKENLNAPGFLAYCRETSKARRAGLLNMRAA